MISTAKFNNAKNEFTALRGPCLAYSEKVTTETFKIIEIDKQPLSFDTKRYSWLKRFVQKLSIEQRTVHIIDNFLEMILCKSDVMAVKTDERLLFDCIHMKLIILKDLADSCKISVQDLLKFASPRVYSNLTYFLLQKDWVHQLIDDFCGFKFYKEHILPRSWFYLILEKDGDFFDWSQLKELTNHKQTSEFAITSNEIKKSLYFLISKIASTNKIELAQKRTLLNQVKIHFGFESDQELATLYNSNIWQGQQKKVTCWFESKCLISLIQENLGLSRKFFMESLLVSADKSQKTKCYDIDLFWEHSFFKNQDEADNKKKNKKITNALEFICKYIKKDSEWNKQSDFSICFLEAFDTMFPTQFDLKNSAAFRQNTLYSFIRIVELLLKTDAFGGYECMKILEEALIQKVLFVLKLAQHEDTVDMSIYCLQILLNLIRIQKTLSIFPQVFSIITHAFIMYNNHPRIQRFTQKIFKKYISDKKSNTVES